MENGLTSMDYKTIEAYAMIGSGDKIAELLKNRGITTKATAEPILNGAKRSIAMATMLFGRSSSTFDVADRLIEKILKEHF